MREIRRLQATLVWEDRVRAEVRWLPLLLGVRWDNGTLREIDDILRKVRAALRSEEGGSSR